jgi:hypothetical protein
MPSTGTNAWVSTVLEQGSARNPTSKRFALRSVDHDQSTSRHNACLTLSYSQTECVLQHRHAKIAPSVVLATQMSMETSHVRDAIKSCCEIQGPIRLYPETLAHTTLQNRCWSSSLLTECGLSSAHLCQTWKCTKPSFEKLLFSITMSLVSMTQYSAHWWSNHWQNSNREFVSAGRSSWTRRTLYQ